MSVTLTTGRPIIHNGVLEQIQVRGGSIGITGQGLDARDTDYTRILSQAAHIQAGIWGAESARGDRAERHRRRRTHFR